MTIGLQSAVAEDVAHAVSGVVKSVDKDSKTFVVKAADGTEHTFKWTEKTTVKGAKETGKGVEAGSKDTAKGVEAGSVDTAKGTEKASVDTYLGAKKGATVTVKYTEKAGEKTAVGIGRFQGYGKSRGISAKEPASNLAALHRDVTSALMVATSRLLQRLL